MTAKRWKGPDILVVGWIPFGITPLPAVGYPPDLATTLLFQAGNPEPPIRFHGKPGFADWLYPLNLIGTKEYRAALYLEGVEAEFPADGSPPQVYRSDDKGYIGYTPLRFFIGEMNVGAVLPQLAQYPHGDGPVPVLWSARDPGGNWVEVHYRAEFKLSWLPNALGRVVTGSWAPHAWCEVVYRIDKEGRINVWVGGSAIPSQRLYINWAMPQANPVAGIFPEYDMLTASSVAVDGFIKTRGWGCHPAPGELRLRWRGQAI